MPAVHPVALRRVLHHPLIQKPGIFPYISFSDGQ
jgi:hypothetical protein